MAKIKITHTDFIDRKMAAVKAYVAVAKECRPAALHAALLTIFEVEDAPVQNWKPIDVEAFKKAVATSDDDNDFRAKLSKL